MSEKVPPLCVIGLTGQSGAGKSTVAALLREMGLCVLDCDAVARAVTAPGSDCLAALAEAFGPEILRADGSLDRACLASLAFADEAGLRRLNELTHPPILRALERALAAAAEAGETLAVLDAPTLFESGADRLCRAVAVVLADEAMRIGRIRRRDGLSQAQAAARLRAQHDDEYYASRAGFVLRNDADAAALRARVEELAAWMRAQ